MIKIVPVPKNGDKLYQWDTSRKIEFDNDIDEIQIENSSVNRSLPVELDTATTATIPYKFLQIAGKLTIYTLKNGNVVDFATFDVKRRKKPFDYVIPSPEAEFNRTIDELEKMIDESGVIE